MVPQPGGGSELHYNLDVQEAAHPSRVMPADSAFAVHVATASSPNAPPATATNAAPAIPNASLQHSAVLALQQTMLPDTAQQSTTQQPAGVLCFGEHVRYLSRTTGQWIPAVIQGHVMVPQPGGGSELHYNLDVQEAAHPSRVMPADSASAVHVATASSPNAPPATATNAAPAIPNASLQHSAVLALQQTMLPDTAQQSTTQQPAGVLCFGEHVRYLSRTTGQWIPAVIQGHVMVPQPGGGSELHYNLDVQEAAHPSRVMLADSTPVAHTATASPTTASEIVCATFTAAASPSTAVAHASTTDCAPSTVAYASKAVAPASTDDLALPHQDVCCATQENGTKNMKPGISCPSQREEAEAVGEPLPTLGMSCERTSELYCPAPRQLRDSALPRPERLSELFMPAPRHLEVQQLPPKKWREPHFGLEEEESFGWLALDSVDVMPKARSLSVVSPGNYWRVGKGTTGRHFEGFTRVIKIVGRSNLLLESLD